MRIQLLLLGFVLMAAHTIYAAEVPREPQAQSELERLREQRATMFEQMPQNVQEEFAQYLSYTELLQLMQKVSPIFRKTLNEELDRRKVVIGYWENGQIQPDFDLPRLPQPPGTIPLLTPLFLAYSPNGKIVVAEYSGQTVALWNLENKTLIGKLPLQDFGIVYCVSFISDSKLLIFEWERQTKLSTVTLWDMKTEEENIELQTKGIVGHKEYLTAAAFSSNGKVLAVAVGFTKKLTKSTIRLWDLERWERKEPIKEFSIPNRLNGFDTSYVTSIAFSPVRNIIAVGSHNGLITLWDLEKEPIEAPIKVLPSLPKRVDSLAFSFDGNLLVAGHEGGKVELLKPSGEKINEINTESYRGDAAISPDGKRIATEHFNIGGIRIWKAVPKEKGQ